MSSVWIASDWHLGPRSPRAHGRLALAFLARAREEDVALVLNGDVFDELFEGAARARAAHPDVDRAIAGLQAAGRLRRTGGNHDPDAGAARLELVVPGAGRVLVAHGHALDPVNASAVGRLGDAVARRFGSTAIVRHAARLAEGTARAVAGERMVALFRARCLRAIDEGSFALGVFGHAHRAHAAAGDRYVNSGWLRDGALEFAVVDGTGARLERLVP